MRSALSQSGVSLYNNCSPAGCTAPSAPSVVTPSHRRTGSGELTTRSSTSPASPATPAPGSSPRGRSSGWSVTRYCLPLSSCQDIIIDCHCQVLCKSHYLELVEGGYGSSTDGDTCESNTENNRNKNRKSKRNRTTFTDEQIHILQANFQIDCNPDGQDLERIADISGLSKRVVQVML